MTISKIYVRVFSCLPYHIRVLQRHRGLVFGIMVVDGLIGNKMVFVCFFSLCSGCRVRSHKRGTRCYACLTGSKSDGHQQDPVRIHIIAEFGDRGDLLRGSGARPSRWFHSPCTLLREKCPPVFFLLGENTPPPVPLGGVFG